MFFRKMCRNDYSSEINLLNFKMSFILWLYADLFMLFLLFFLIVHVIFQDFYESNFYMIQADFLN